jgi:hypothetical protein
VTAGAAVLAVSALVAPTTAHAEAGCEWITTDLPVPAGYNGYSLVGDGTEWIATGGWARSATVWHQDVPATREFAEQRIPTGVNGSGVLVTANESNAWRGAEALAPLPGKTKAWARSINAGGEVLGLSGTAVVVWPAGSTTPRLLEGTDNGLWWIEKGLDDAGNAIGYAVGPVSQDLGHVWDRQGTRTSLQVLPGHYEAQPEVIHDGRVFGFSMPKDAYDARVWVEWNLQGEIVRTMPGEVLGVNDAGDVLVNRATDGQTGVQRVDGRFDPLPADVSASVLTENGDVYGTIGDSRVVKVSCA